MLLYLAPPMSIQGARGGGGGGGGEGGGREYIQPLPFFTSHALTTVDGRHLQCKTGTPLFQTTGKH